MDFDEGYRIASELLSGIDLSLNDDAMLAEIRTNLVSTDGIVEDGPQLDSLIEEAQSNPIAWNACHLLIERCHEYNNSVPRALKQFFGNVIREKNPCPKKRGKSETVNSYRDFMVIVVMDALKKSGVSPTRNRTGSGVSGAAIVQAVLRDHQIYLDESAIAKIWEQRKRKIKPYSIGY